MRLNKIDREEFRRRVKILIPRIKKSEIVNHFQKEGYPRRIIYDTGHPTSWTSARKNQLHRLTNGVCQINK